MAPRVEDRAIDDRSTQRTNDPSSRLAPVTLILGGARSGKSARAETMIEGGLGARWDGALYIATAQQSVSNEDPEMTARIRDHKARRGAAWTTVEEPLDLPGALGRHGGPRHPVLVDCLTLWLTNTMLSGADCDAATTQLIDGFTSLPGPVIFVSSEVGLGIVPDNAMAREFRDYAGRLNQRVAAAAQRVEFIAAGLPVILKNETL
jgi:adenosylcobinamide kinase / adenosylcobinamide-phosphate guanylyltransferase